MNRVRVDDALFTVGLIVTFAGILAGGGLALYMVFTPPQTITIVNANLTGFELTTGIIPATSLFYNLTFTMSIKNYVWQGDASYYNMEIDCYYNAEQFYSVKIGELTIGPGSTLLLNKSASGNSTVDVEHNNGDALRRSNEMRFLDMEIWLKGTREFPGETLGDPVVSYRCKLRLPLLTSQNNSMQHQFKPVKCSHIE